MKEIFNRFIKEYYLIFILLHFVIFNIFNKGLVVDGFLYYVIYYLY